jgi:uncharacterized membrane protein YkvA (DUF1232 family)
LENALSGNKILRWQDMGGNFLSNTLLRFKLIIRLMKDQRVNIWLKAIPIFTLVYFVSPFDIPGPIDDALVIWFGTELFVDLCPQDIVMEYIRGLQKTVTPESEELPQDVVDADFKEIKKDE